MSGKTVTEYLSVDALIAGILERGWVFEIETGPLLLQNGSPMRLLATSWNASARTPDGEMRREGRTPYLALEGALNGAKRMYGESP